MDDRRFDGLARGLGRAANRRGTIAALGATLLGIGIRSEARAGKGKGKGDNDKKDCMCCEYRCSGSTPVELKYVCHRNAERGRTRCDSGFEGCSFQNGYFLNRCRNCGPADQN